MKPKQIFELDKNERKELERGIRERGTFAIIHDHRVDYGCPGDCLMLNLPDDIRSELSTEV